VADIPVNFRRLIDPDKLASFLVGIVLDDLVRLKQRKVPASPDADESRVGLPVVTPPATVTGVVVAKDYRRGALTSRKRRPDIGDVDFLVGPRS